VKLEFTLTLCAPPTTIALVDRRRFLLSHLCKRDC